MKIAELRIWAREALRGLSELAGLSKVPPETVSLEVDLLLAQSLGCRDTELLTNSSRNVTEEEETEFRSLVERRAKNEPLAHISGVRDFYSIQLIVSPDVLIPRPETEIIVDKSLLHFTPELKSFHFVDVGTGSGAILLAVLYELKSQYGESYLERGSSIGIDISSEALSVAEKNAERLNLKSFVSFKQSDLLQGISFPEGDVELEIYAANLPYISLREELPLSVSQYEPQAALYGGRDGLDVIKRFVVEVAPRIKKGAVAYLEIGYQQKTAVESLLAQTGLKTSSIYKDFQGVERVLEVRC